MRALRILNESGGSAKSVSDEEILRAQRLLAQKEGIFVEPASASAIACLEDLVSAGQLERDERVVCILTGSGLKDVKSASHLLQEQTEVGSLGKLEQSIDRLLRM
jgi:threonine synthase